MGANEGTNVGGTEREHASPCGEPLCYLPHQPRTPGSLVQRPAEHHTVCHPRREVVLQTLADARQVMHGSNPNVPETLGRADARELQQVRRIDCPGGKDDLTGGSHPVLLLIAAINDGDRPTVDDVQP
jgi:hypothetical protein